MISNDHKVNIKEITRLVMFSNGRPSSNPTKHP